MLLLFKNILSKCAQKERKYLKAGLIRDKPKFLMLRGGTHGCKCLAGVRIAIFNLELFRSLQ